MYLMETRKDYTNLKILGRGTKGEITTKVRDLYDQKLYVIKNLGTQKLLESQKDILKLLGEDKCQFIVKHYPNDDRDDEIKTDFIENGDLQDYITTIMDLGKPIEEKILWKIFLQCLEGLKYLHENNIIHKNIRLENIYVTDDMDIKLGNFRYASFNNNNFDEVMYYPEDGMFYKNSDALNNNIYNEYSDLYALGVVFYQLCYYEFPFEIIEQNGKYELKKNPEKETKYVKEIKDFINKLILDKKPDIDKLYKTVVKNFIRTNVSDNLIESSLRCFCSFGGLIHRLTDKANPFNPTYKYKDDTDLKITSNIIQACIYFQYQEGIGNKIDSNYEDYIDNIKNSFITNYKIKNGQGPKIIDVIQFLFDIYKQEVRKKFPNDEKFIKLCKVLNGTMEISDMSSLLKDLKFKYKKIPRYIAIPLIKINQFKLDSKENILTKFKYEEEVENKINIENYDLAGYVIKKIIDGKEQYIPIYQKKIESKSENNEFYDFEFRSSEGETIKKIDEQRLLDNSEGTIEILFYKQKRVQFFVNKEISN